MSKEVVTATTMGRHFPIWVAFCCHQLRNTILRRAWLDGHSEPHFTAKAVFDRRNRSIGTEGWTQMGSSVWGQMIELKLVLFHFRFAKYYRDAEGIEYRTLFKAYGIRFDVMVNGKVRFQARIFASLEKKQGDISQWKSSFGMRTACLACCRKEGLSFTLHNKGDDQECRQGKGQQSAPLIPKNSLM